MTIIIGIDPGLDGAVAVLNEAGELIGIHDMPCLDDGAKGRRIAEYRSGAYALLVVSTSEPAGFDPDSHVLRMADGSLVLERPAKWSRRFTLDRIRFAGGQESAIVVPDASDWSLPIAPTPCPEPGPALAPPEPVIARRLIFAVGGHSISDAERARWPADATFVRGMSEAAEAVRAVDGVTEITVAASHRGGDVGAEARRIETTLVTQALGKRAIVKASEQRLLDPHAAAA